jgi:hypothetical protein
MAVKILIKRKFSWLIFTGGACYFILQAILGCFGGTSTLPIGSELDTINAYFCECSFETSARQMTDPDGNDGLYVIFDQDDATEASAVVAVYEEDLVMETDSWVGVRFRGIRIPRYSIIKSAHVEFTAAEVNDENTNVMIWLENSTNTDAFLEEDGNVSSRTRTEDVVNWIVEDRWTPNSKWDTPDFAHLVQNFVDKDMWRGDENNSLVVLFETLSGYRNPKSAHSGDDTAPKLIVEYAPVSKAKLAVCLGQEIDRCGTYKTCEETPHKEIIESHCQTEVTDTFSGLVTAAGYVPSNAQISCKPWTTFPEPRFYADAFLSPACEAECSPIPFNGDNFDPEAANACISEAVKECRDAGGSPDECNKSDEVLMCMTYVSATHAGADEPICVVDGPGSDTNEPEFDASMKAAIMNSTSTAAMPLARQLFGQRSICEVEGLTYINVDDEYTPNGGPAATEGRLTFFGGPCPGAKCYVGFASALGMANIAFDSGTIFVPDPVFKQLVQTAITYPGVALVGDGTYSEVFNRGVEAVGRGARGSEGGIFFGTNDSSSENPLSLNVNWTGKTCSLAGDLLRSVDREGQPALCDGDGDKQCFRDSDCGVGPCILETEDATGYCEGDGTTACETDEDCYFGPCGDLPMDEGVLTAWAQYDGVLLNQPPRADASGTQAQVECTSYDGAVVELDGAGSSDPDCDISLVSWLKGGRHGYNVGDTLVATNLLALNEPTDYTLRVFDAYAQSDEDTTMVVVRDTTPPTFEFLPDDVTAECTAPDATGTLVDLGTALASDICDQEPNVSNNSPDRFKLGDTTVTWTATDEDNNDVSADQLVTVIDTTPPEIFCNAPGTINPTDAGDDKADPEDRAYPIEPVAFTATAVDTCDPDVPAVITEFDCFAFTKKGKRIDKTDSCVVTFSGDTITISDTGGVDTHISWTVTAEDDTGNPPNANEVVCKVEVISYTSP